MPPRYRFSPGRIHPVVAIDGRLVLLCALTVAVLRVAFGLPVALDANSMFARGLGGVARGLVPYLPIFVTLWQFRVLDKWYSFLAVVLAWSLGNAGFWMVARVAALGGPLAVFADLPGRYALGGGLQFLAAWLLVRALFAWRAASWETRVWATPKRVWVLLPLRDVGVGAMVASALAWVYVSTLWLIDDIGLAVAGFGILAVSAVVQAIEKGPPATTIRVDADLPADEQRLAFCRQLGAEPCPSSPTDQVLAGRALWFRDALTMTRVDSTEGPRWLIVGLDALWDRRAWVLPVPVFKRLRPDLAPFLDLPPGWVVTTEPGRVVLDPGTAGRVADAIARCRFLQANQESMDAQKTVLTVLPAENS